VPTKPLTRVTKIPITRFIVLLLRLCSSDSYNDALMVTHVTRSANRNRV
jgi:hypothetical protein